MGGETDSDFKCTAFPYFSCIATVVKCPKLDSRRELHKPKAAPLRGGLVVPDSGPSSKERHIDSPGPANFMENMISGAAPMAAAILLVSAADSALPWLDVLLDQRGLAELALRERLLQYRSPVNSRNTKCGTRDLQMSAGLPCRLGRTRCPDAEVERGRVRNQCAAWGRPHLQRAPRAS